MEQAKRLNIAIPAAALLMAAFYLLLVRYALHTYINWRSPGFLLGLVAIPVVLTYNPRQKRSLRFYYAALACCLLAWVLPVKTLLYACIVLAGCFLADNILGKINGLPLLAFGLMGPIADYITRIFTFPIRLQLTNSAAGLLQRIGLPAVAQGNSVLYQGSEFAVDEACMGLGMMVTSLLCGIMLLGVYQKKYARRLAFPHVCLLLAGIGLLNVVSNLFRIILLVVLHILPDNPLHDVTGIVCLLVYVIAPLVWLCPLLVRRLGRAVRHEHARHETDTFMLTMAHILLAACVFMVAYKTKLPGATAQNTPTSLLSVAGYTYKPMDNKVTKAENGHALVYLKEVGGFYHTDHNPTICWQGSGYAFRQVKEEVLGGRKVYTAILEKGKDRLYTAWWYDNGAAQTISQWDWRWDSFVNGHRYTLVNVTAETPAGLKEQAMRWLQ